MAYGDFKDLSKRTASDKAFNIAENPKYGCHCGLASVIYKFFDKKFNCLQINLLQVEQLKMKLCLIKN